MTNTHPTTGTPERAMQAQCRVNDARELASLLKFTNGEYPVSGDETRKRYLRWREFRTPSVWTYAGVRA